MLYTDTQGNKDEFLHSSSMTIFALGQWKPGNALAAAIESITYINPLWFMCLSC